MVEGYELVEYRDLKGRPFWELTTSPANSQFQKMLTDPKKKLAARKMIDQISKIYDYGLKVASGTSKLRCIDSKIGLYELKGFDGANREMIYAICQGVDDRVENVGVRTLTVGRQTQAAPVLESGIAT